MMKKYIANIIIILSGIVFITSCSTTKRLGEDEVLYTGVKKMKREPIEGVKVDGDVISAVKDPLSVPPNNPLYSPYYRTPFPFGLWVYNNFVPKKNKGFKHWFYNKFAKEPVLISGVQPELRIKVVEDILANYGYFGAEASYSLLYNKKNKKKAKISYSVKIPQAWTYGSISYPKPTDGITQLIDSTKAQSLLRVGSQYNADSLSAERTRIATLARNNGYYYFRPEYIEYLADTTQEHLKVNLRMIIKKGIPTMALKAYTVGKIDISLQNSTGKGIWDTIYYKDMKMAYQKPLRVKQSIMPSNITLRPGQVYSVTEQDQSQTNLSRLGIFRYINLNVTPIDSLRGADSLNVQIDGAMDIPLESEFEIDVSSKSNSFIGPGMIFGVNHKNIFRGGEILSVKLNGSYEWQTGKKQSGSKSSLLNSYEIGLNANLSFPRLLVPKFIPRPQKYGARTNFQLGTDLMNRPHFFRMISFNASGGYEFQTSDVSYHNLTVLKLTYNKLLNTTKNFDETMDKNPAIALSFRNQFIPTISYTYTFNKSFGRKGNNRILWQTNGTQAGNILAGVMGLLGDKGEKHLFGNQFSQFVKGSTELKYYRRLWGDNWLASRFLVGAGHAYGNSKVMPYSEQFYIGGANSIRAFTIRTLGPGSYRPPQDNPNAYFDQTGDFKLEANIEFRFKIIGDLHGAIFMDAGNIWLLKEDPQRPGGKLTLKSFGKDIALGTGFGLRYDISYIVLRADLGIGLHTPYSNPDKKGYYNLSSFKNSLGFHLAIGYPF